MRRQPQVAIDGMAVEETMIASPGFLQLTTADSRRGVCAKGSPGVDPHKYIPRFGES
jgi:hypothetical protein